MILSDYNPEKVYFYSKKEIDEINRNINELTFIKNSLLIFHRYKYLDEIKEITKIIKEINEKKIKNYNNKLMKESI